MSKYLNSIIRLINKNGNDNLSLITISQTIDPDNPLFVNNTESIDSIKSYQGHYKDKQIDGENIKATDIKLYVDPSTVNTTIEENDKITDGTITYNIKNVKSYKEVNDVVLYILQLRL